MYCLFYPHIFISFSVNVLKTLLYECMFCCALLNIIFYKIALRQKKNLNSYICANNLIYIYIYIYKCVCDPGAQNLSRWGIFVAIAKTILHGSK